DRNMAQRDVCTNGL
ncbi:putative transport domain protein, partial [Vibrio parahaemolyticus VPTS-2010]